MQISKLTKRQDIAEDAYDIEVQKTHKYTAYKKDLLQRKQELQAQIDEIDAILAQINNSK